MAAGVPGFRTTLYRRLVVHRRAVSAALAFTSVLLGIAAVTGAPHAEPGMVGPSTDSAAIGEQGELEAPIRLADPGVAQVISPGDVVDVVVASPRVATTVVAAEVVVTQVPSGDGDSPWSSTNGLLMVAVTEAQALDLAGAAARGPVTVLLHR